MLKKDKTEVYVVLRQGLEYLPVFGCCQQQVRDVREVRSERSERSARSERSERTRPRDIARRSEKQRGFWEFGGLAKI